MLTIYPLVEVVHLSFHFPNLVFCNKVFNLKLKFFLKVNTSSPYYLLETDLFALVGRWTKAISCNSIKLLGNTVIVL